MKRIEDILKGKVVIVGIGNPLRGDDGFGPALVEKLKGQGSAVCIDAGNAPEGYIGKIAKEGPDTVLLVDIVHLDCRPGEYEILKKSEIVRSGFTTHDISPAMFIEHLERETHAAIYMLGVQPQCLSFGDEMSEPVVKTMEHLETVMKEVLRA